jgi:hypothetical protein
VAEAGRRAATYIGEVASVQGGKVTIRLEPTSSTLMLIRGESYRIGQIGAFVRIPLGYSDLYAVATQTGASQETSPRHEEAGILEATEPTAQGFRWLTASLFGETSSGHFQRGVSQYPTVGDEVHVVTAPEMDTIYERSLGQDDLTIGRIASSSGIPARLRLSTLVTRHSTIVGSTGSGKSNLVAVIIEELSSGNFPSARVLVIDPHGEYSNVVPDASHVIRTGTDKGSGDERLHVPYWALPLDQLLALTMGDMPPVVVEHIRDRVRQLKVESASLLPEPLPVQAITADSPLPFSIRRLWYELEDEERATFAESSNQTEKTRNSRTNDGDQESLIPPAYPPATSFNTAPYPNRARRQISRQLDLLRSRIRDDQFDFMFSAEHPTAPDHDGRIAADLDSLLTSWIGSESPITILDVSGLPAEALGAVVGTLTRIVYDALFWSMNLPVGGRQQPLLIIVDEAHLFLPNGLDSPAHRTFSRIAKEGRKYGVGLMVVTQRPSDVDVNVLSQCGTMIALRVTNGLDRASVSGAVPDDLGGLTDMLPSLRTGEALVLGDALQIPSRVRVRSARSKPTGGDPLLPEAWLAERPGNQHYKMAIQNWRLRSTAATDTEKEIANEHA